MYSQPDGCRSNRQKTVEEAAKKGDGELEQLEEGESVTLCKKRVYGCLGHSEARSPQHFPVDFHIFLKKAMVYRFLAIAL